MRDFVLQAVDMLRRQGVDYGDVRLVTRRLEHLEVKNGRTEAVTSDHAAGFGVRVIVEGCWGFAAGTVFKRDELARVVKLAVEIARASAKVSGKPAVLSPVKPETDRKSVV